MTRPHALAHLAFLALALGLAALGGAHSSAQDARAGRASRDRHAALTEGLDCANCHTTASWDMAEGRSAGRGFDHARTGFPLSGHHALATCAECHRPDVEVRRDCASCHQDDHHQGRLGRRCDACHGATSWTDTRPLELHRSTRLPLTGMHALADCTECHARTGEREWTQPPADCFACHEADYRRSDVHPNHAGTRGSPPFPRDCGQCHVPTGWAPALVDPALLPRSEALTEAPPEHELAFAIRRGPHRGAPCASCHVAPELPRVVECTGCHVHDPVTLQRQHRGQAYSPVASSCLGCHPGGMGR